MTKSKHSTTRLLLAAGTLLCLAPSLAIAQRPTGGKGKKARASSEPETPRGARGNPDELATKMIADHDENRDAELKVDELTAALSAQRQQRAGGPEQRSAGKPVRKNGGKGKRGTPKRGEQQRGAGSGSKGGQAPRGQRGPTSRGADPAQIASKLIAEFDNNRSGGLDLQELVLSIKTQRQNRGGKGEPKAERPGGKGGRERAEQGRRPRKGDSAETGQGEGPDQGRQTKRKAKSERENIEPGTGVVPKRPGQ